MSGHGDTAGASGPVSTLELFFDLVFVFALTQVTAAVAADLSGRGVLRGVLVVALLWWSWTCYAWLANLVRTEEGVVRLGVLAAMAAMFVLALTIPEAFDDAPGGLSGPVVLAACYVAFRALHLLLFFALSAGDAALRAQLRRFAPAMLGAGALLLAAAVTDGATRTALWAAAVAVDYLGTYLGGARGWRVRVDHFAERHGLIVIVALGESIVAIGVGVAQLPVSWPIVTAAVLGLALSAGLWWAYFDVAALRAEHALLEAPAHRRARLAQDAYSYLHLPLVTGVVLMALGLKKVLEQVGEAEHHAPGEPLEGWALAALVGGVVLYLLAHVAFERRSTGRLAGARLLAAALAAVLGPLGGALPALTVLAVLAALVVALAVVESARHAQERAHLHRVLRDRPATAHG
ncbi:low temperature requirement protein A [Kineococcus gypseus]|uniref:low temperature requirement protein A n=1 Tax=Kineococcus gypseus TaxID=1637102 RepID=UPI003D7D1AEF